MGKSMFDLRGLPVVGQSGPASGVAVSALVGVVANANLPSYATYTPTWTSSGTAPAIGNAVVVARYTQIGKLVHATGKIAFGSTSTYGTGSYRFALPVASTGTGTGEDMPGGAWLYDSSSGNFAEVICQFISATTVGLAYGATYLGAYTAVAQTAPWTWATSDRIQWNLIYEAA